MAGVSATVVASDEVVVVREQVHAHMLLDARVKQKKVLA